MSDEKLVRLRMTVGLASSDYSLSPGDEKKFPQAEAKRLIEAGYAVPVVAEKAEKAVNTPIVEKRA